MEVGGQRHAPPALPPGKDPVPTVQMYGSPDIKTTAYNTITLQVTEKWISKYCVSAVKAVIISTADFDPPEVIQCRTVHSPPNWSSSYMIYIYIYIYPPHGATAPSGPGFSHLRDFIIILKHTAFGRTPLEEWSARRKDLYLTTQNTHNRQTSMLQAGFEHTIPEGERPQTHALERPMGPAMYTDVTYI
jgi:hypothetical protein